MNIIEEVLSACVSSAKSEPITLIQGKKTFKAHSQLHVMLNMPFGADKSTMVESIENKKKYIYECVDYTFPGIIGSIDKTGKLNLGAVYLAAGKCLWIDEHHSIMQNSRRGLLKMLEQQCYGRDLGYDVISPMRKRSKLRSIMAEGGHFEVSSRFSCLATGVFAARKSLDDKAFLSRFMPLVFNITTDDAYDMSMGKKSFRMKVSPSPGGQIFEDYEKFWKTHKEVFKILQKNNPKLGAFIGENPGLLRRNLLHFSRLFSWVSGTNSVIDDWEKYTPYIPIFLYNYATSSLTLSEFEVLRRLKSGLSNSLISRQLSVSEAYISKVVKKLKGLGLG